MGGGRGQAKIDVYNYYVIISPFEEIYDEFFQILAEKICKLKEENVS